MDHALTGGAVIHHHRELHHVLFFQLPGVHIGEDIAVLPGGGSQIQHKGRIQVVQHFHAQIRPGVVALVHHYHRGQLPQHLDQRCIRRIGQQYGIILEILGEFQQVSILLVDLAHVLFLAVNAQGGVAQHTDRKHLPDGIGGKLLAAQEHFLRIHAHPSGKVRIEPQAVFVIRVGQVPDGLCENGVRRHKPHHHLGFVHGHGVKNAFEGGTGHKGLSTAGGDFCADMGNTGNGRLVGRDAAQPYGDILIHPVTLPGGEQFTVPVQMAQVGGQIVHDLLLIGFQLHNAASLQL